MTPDKNNRERERERKEKVWIAVKERVYYAKPSPSGLRNWVVFSTFFYGQFTPLLEPRKSQLGLAAFAFMVYVLPFPILNVCTGRDSTEESVPSRLFKGGKRERESGFWNNHSLFWSSTMKESGGNQLTWNSKGKLEPRMEHSWGGNTTAYKIDEINKDPPGPVLAAAFRCRQNQAREKCSCMPN